MTNCTKHLDQGKYSMSNVAIPDVPLSESKEMQKWGNKVASIVNQHNIDGIFSTAIDGDVVEKVEKLVNGDNEIRRAINSQANILKRIEEMQKNMNNDIKCIKDNLDKKRGKNPDP